MKRRYSSNADIASLAMMYEVCAYPKPGNVDRCHDYAETALEHFLESAILSHDVFKDAEGIENGVGHLIKEAVIRTALHGGGNTHFGAFILLFPLVMGGGIEAAVRIVKNTTSEDAVLFYEAFGLTSVRMHETDNELDVNDPSSIDRLKEGGMTLYDVMAYSSENDMVANEWTNGFRLTRKMADMLHKNGPGRDSIVKSFVIMLSEDIDTFIVKKLGAEMAVKTKSMAEDAVKGEVSLEEFDEWCHHAGANPGSIADITIAGLFIAMKEGWEWEF